MPRGPCFHCYPQCQARLGQAEFYFSNYKSPALEPPKLQSEYGGCCLQSRTLPPASRASAHTCTGGGAFAVQRPL